MSGIRQGGGLPVTPKPYVLALLAEAYTKVGQHETGLTLLAEALAVTNDTEEHRWEAELYRL
jgi:hypothetical protein